MAFFFRNTQAHLTNAEVLTLLQEQSRHVVAQIRRAKEAGRSIDVTRDLDDLADDFLETSLRHLFGTFWHVYCSPFPHESNLWPLELLTPS